MIKIEAEESVDEYCCNVCNNRKPEKLYNIYFVNNGYSTLQRLCEKCLEELGRKIEEQEVEPSCRY